MIGLVFTAEISEVGKGRSYLGAPFQLFIRDSRDSASLVLMARDRLAFSRLPITNYQKIRVAI